MSKGINFEENPSILNNFLLYLQDSKNFSILTIKGYESDLRMFFNFILDYKGFELEFSQITIFMILKIKTDDIYTFLVYLNNEKNSCATTRQRKLAAIKSFFKWLFINNQNICKEDPASQIPTIIKHFRLPKYLTLEQAKKIQNVFNVQNSTYPIRDNAIITLFVTTGIRISELLDINIGDINFESSKITIRGKGNKEREVYLNKHCEAILMQYIGNRKNVREDPLFLSSQKKRISKSTVEYICHKAYNILGIGEKRYSPHTLRHTFATVMYDTTKDILLLKSILGHSTILSTEIYTHTKKETIKEAVEKNPLSNFNVA